MIAALRGRGIEPILMTPNPVAAPQYPPTRNVTLRPYVDAVRDLARTRDVPLVDVYARFAELAIEGTDLNTLFTDAMHPNPRGHELIAEWLAPVLRAGH
jgi:lysophospholipase L1-like esterase